MKKPAYVSAYRDRHGVLRWRFRRPGFPQSQTREQFGTEAWWTWYGAADAAKKVEIGSKRTVAGSLSAVVVAYYASADFKRLAPVTQKTYRNIIERFRETAGALPVAKITSANVRKWVDNRADRPAAANTFLKVFRALMRFAIERDMLKADPTIGVRPVKSKTDGHHTWTEAEISAFEAKWSLGTRERLAFDLLLYTAQRSGGCAPDGAAARLGRPCCGPAGKDGPAARNPDPSKFEPIDIRLRERTADLHRDPTRQALHRARLR